MSCGTWSAVSLFLYGNQEHFVIIRGLGHPKPEWPLPFHCTGRR